MLLNQLNRQDAEKVFIAVQNAAGEQLSVGVNVCFDFRNTTSLGSAVVKPLTSLLPLFAGVVAGGSATYADIATNAYGLVQAYGVMGSVAYNVGAASLSAAGQWLIPVTALYSGQTYRLSGLGLSWTSESLIIARGAFLMNNDLSGTGWTNAFVRAL